MGKTKIEWTEHSWNPISGCSHAGSPGCDMCYARRMARRLAGRYGYPEYPHHFDVTLHPNRLNVPLRRKKPTVYFVCSMSDLFHKDVPDEFILHVFDTMYYGNQHIYQVLTKRPGRMAELWTRWTSMDYLGFVPRNVWLGVSVENQATADERIPLLLQCPAAVRFVSCEPLLSAVDLTKWLSLDQWLVNPLNQSGEAPATLDWVICGGESGPGARPMHPDWARSLRDQCQEAGVSYFFKQHGAWQPVDQSDERVPSNTQEYVFPDGTISLRIGKKAAGHLLDGREWQEWPR